MQKFGEHLDLIFLLWSNSAVSFLSFPDSGSRFLASTPILEAIFMCIYQKLPDFIAYVLHASKESVESKVI